MIFSLDAGFHPWQKQFPFQAGPRTGKEAD
jgi:hypothetical protein